MNNQTNTIPRNMGIHGKKKRMKSLRSHIASYFIFFSIAVFSLLWIIQIVFLPKFYVMMKTQDIKRMGNHMSTLYSEGDYEEKFNTLGREQDTCILVVDRYFRQIYSQDLSNEICLIHGFHSQALDYIKKLVQSENDETLTKVFNEHLGTETLLLVKKIEIDGETQGYILLNTELAPVGSTVSIIKKQLLLITFLLLSIGVIFSMLVSKKLARPIDNLKKSAERMASGDYQVHFDGSQYQEINSLANTLNYAAQEVSRVDTMQKDLIANVSHDLRTPLTMVKAYAEMIRDLSGDNPKKREEHLSIIIDETDRLALMVNDILDLSKLESGGLSLNLDTLLISERLNEIVCRYRGLSEKMGYQIEFTPDEEREVYCDAGKIEQVICNLIHNAINYTGKDKKIFVRQINLKDGVRIEIADTGDGIENDKIALIFDKYYRSENHKRVTVGTGLGLSIVKAILKLHNFPFGVTSTLGEGSVFWFEIKINNMEPPKQS